LVWLKLIICVLVIFFAGQKVAKQGDIIAEKTGAGRVWMGVIAIALITSLPELFAGISAVTIVRQPDLTVGNLLGANAFNLFNLALLDFFHKDASIFIGASPSHRITAWYSLLVLAAVAAALGMSLAGYPLTLGWIGWYTPVIFILYAFSVRQVFTYEKNLDKEIEPELYGHVTGYRNVVLWFIFNSLLIVGAGFWLAIIGDEIAAVTGWGETFVGTLFLAFATTLPEITVSFTAVRIGAVDLAIANMVGSNLFNLAILGITDLFYTRGPVLKDVAPGALVTAGIVAAMTLLLIVGVKRRPYRVFRLSWLNVSLTLLFLTGAYLSFSLS
jgi:cation:H+ antiporter